MAQRLPIVGSDNNTWGSILNGFLSVSLNSDGTLNTSAVSTAGAEMTSNKGVASGYAGLNASTLVPSTQLGSGTASSSNFLRGDGVWAVPSSGSSTLASDSDVTISSPANNQVLTYNSGTSKWVNQGPQAVNGHTIVTKTGSYTLTTSDEVVLANASSASLTLTLPTAVGNTNQYDLKKVDSSTHTVTVATTSSQTIDGGSTAVIKVQYASVSVVSDGSNWYII